MKRFILFFVFVGLIQTAISQVIKTTLTYSVNDAAKRTNKSPVLIMLHGYGSNESDLFDISKALDSRFITFSLRAPIEVGEGGYCWYVLNRTPGQNATYDYKIAKESAAKILSFISNACKAYNVDSTQVYLMGFSQGAIMSYELALASPKKIKGILALSGRLMEESKTIKTNGDFVAKIKVFMAHGYSDNVIKIDEAEKAFAFFKEKKVTDVTYKSYEMTHTISGAELNDIKAWLIKAISPVKKTEQKKMVK
jgi:phospholipase/carboxylesterase